MKEDKMKGKGFKLAEVITAAVILLLIIVFVLPILSKRETVSSVVVCRSRLYMLGRVMQMYSSDNNGKYPTTAKWCDSLATYFEGDEAVFVCPGVKEEKAHYAINPNCEPNSPPDMVLLFESKGGWNQSGGPELLTTENHERRGCNVLFNDIHVSFIPLKDVPKLKWKDEQKE